MQQALIAVIVVCCCSSSVIGGYSLYKDEEERSRRLDLEVSSASSTNIVVYSDCDYKGESFTTEEDEGTLTSDVGFQSILIPTGFKVDTYAGENKTGVKIGLGGPSAAKCTKFKSMEWSKT